MTGRRLLIAVGILLVLLGGLWTLQGLNVLGGSAMSGSATWATIGPIVLVAGLIMAGVGLIRKSDRPAH